MPTDRPDEERVPPTTGDDGSEAVRDSAAPELLEGSASDPLGDGDLEGEGTVSPFAEAAAAADAIPRQTRPFRAWGAAHERAPGPSVGERFAGWLRGIFGRKEKTESATTATESVVEYSPETRPMGRTSFDDLDAPWADDPFPVYERRSSRPSSERPSVEDFEATWDGSYDSEEELARGTDPVDATEPIASEPIADESTVSEPIASDPIFDERIADEPIASDPIFDERSADEPIADQPIARELIFEEVVAQDPGLAEPAIRPDADPLWDSPIVAATSAQAPEAFVSGDLDEVWSPESGTQEPGTPAPEPMETEAPRPEAPKLGFFARLFGRKPKVEQPTIAEQERAAAADWAIDIAEAEARHPSYMEPADADFASDAAAASPPTAGDFADEAPAFEAPADSDFAGEAPAFEAPADDDFAVVAPAVEAPADGDFADEAPVVEAQADSDFAELAAMPAERVDDIEVEVEVDMDDDAAKLAAILGPIGIPAADEDAPTQLISATPDAFDEAPSADAVEEFTIVEETIVVEETADGEAVVEATLDVSDTEPLLELPVVSPEESPKKAGFFSSLLKRVSRSMFIPKAAVEAEAAPVPAMESSAVEEQVEQEEQVEEMESAAPVEEMEGAAAVEELAAPVEEMEIEARADEIEIAASVEEMEIAAQVDEPATEFDAEVSLELEEPAPEIVAEALPDIAEFVAEGTPTPADTAEQLDSTQPFPAFRDARDDFLDEPAPVADSRPTEQVEIPAFDESEKTDEFARVPPVEPGVDTAEFAPAPGFWARLFGRKAETAGEGAAGVAPITLDGADGKLPFVLAKFRTFYNEIIRDKHQKSDVISGFATAIVSAAPAEMADPEFAAQLLSKRLSEMLELQAAESNWTGGDAAKYYPDAQYAMVALADETFATIEWPGRPSWHKYMLEPRLYGTRGADIEFFKRIDKLLKDNPDPPKGARDLARVYLLVIASGFRGKFRQPKVHRPLAEYRRRLYEFSHRADPLELYARDRRIFPAAVEHTLESRAVGRFTSRQRWIAAVIVLTLLYAGVSHYAWSRLSAGLKDVMARIETIDAGTGRTP